MGCAPTPGRRGIDIALKYGNGVSQANAQVGAKADKRRPQIPREQSDSPSRTEIDPIDPRSRARGRPFLYGFAETVLSNVRVWANRIGWKEDLCSWLFFIVLVRNEFEHFFTASGTISFPFL